MGCTIYTHIYGCQVITDKNFITAIIQLRRDIMLDILLALSFCLFGHEIAIDLVQEYFEVYVRIHYMCRGNCFYLLTQV